MKKALSRAVAALPTWGRVVVIALAAAAAVAVAVWKWA